MNLKNLRRYLTLGSADFASSRRYWILSLVIPIFIISSFEAHAADITMECSGVLYKYDENLFKSDEVKVRRDGAWIDWCDGDLDIIDNSGRCISEYTQKVEFPISTADLLDDGFLDKHLVAYCNCGARFRPEDQDYLTCLKKFDVGKYTVFLNGLKLRDSGLSLDDIVMDFNICPKLRSGSIDLASLIEEYPGLLEKDYFFSVPNQDLDANMIMYIDFLGLKINTEYQTIIEPKRKQWSSQAVCRLVEN